LSQFHETRFIEIAGVITYVSFHERNNLTPLVVVAQWRGYPHDAFVDEMLKESVHVC
jgi:hypothetical protein